ADVFKDKDFPWEAEDLFPPALIEGFIAEHGKDAVQTGSAKRQDGEWHYDISRAGKDLLGDYLDQHVTAGDVTLWVQLLELIRARLRLGTPDPLPAAVKEPEKPARPAPAAPPDGSALVVAGRLDYAEYVELGAYITEPERTLAPDLSHLGFYVDGAIQPVIPRILARYNHIAFTAEVRDQLRATGRPSDARLADVIDRATVDGGGRAGQRWQVLLLSPADGDGTVTLQQPVTNTKTNARGRPFAWTVGHRVTRLSALLQGPATTDELEALGG
ncbi:MAG: hypothetical protein ACRD0K_29025, partial [Egibacteraceae bacterium]